MRRRACALIAPISFTPFLTLMKPSMTLRPSKSPHTAMAGVPACPEAGMLRILQP